MMIYDPWNTYVIIRRCRAVNNDWSKNSVCILSWVMRMIPRWSIWVCNKWIGKAFARSDWALRNRRDTVHPSNRICVLVRSCKGLTLIFLRRILLQESMPMNWCSLFRIHNIILNGDLNSVAPTISQVILDFFLVIALVVNPYQFASINGPGNCPLITKEFFVYPSGAISFLPIEKSYFRITLENCKYIMDWGHEMGVAVHLPSAWNI